MRDVTLFIAMSLDGYAADAEGGVDWLKGQASGRDDMSSYHGFIKGVDTVVMGWNTYHQIAAELSPGAWFYKGLTSYVLTRRRLPSTPEIRFTSEDTCALIRRLRAGTGREIWICGGPGVIRPLVRADLIDRFHISVIPTLLGGGLRLFGDLGGEHRLRLIETRSYNGITDLVYGRRDS